MQSPAEPSGQRFRRLLEPVHDKAQTFARCLCRSRADGDDLYQEALLRALDRLETLREDTAFRGWLYRVIVSVHRNRHRARFWRRFIPLAGDEPASGDHAESLGAAERARVALAELPPDQREALVLHEIEGWLVDEIAALHDVSASAVKSRLARGRDRLRSIYSKRFGVHAVDAGALVPGETP
jgi:RNA polymerase sigma-70 factor (ECF subfamily)